jgi:hypothetical protein
LKSLGLDQHEYNEVVADLLDIAWSMKSSDVSEEQFRKQVRTQIDELRSERGKFEVKLRGGYN